MIIFRRLDGRYEKRYLVALICVRRLRILTLHAATGIGVPKHTARRGHGEDDIRIFDCAGQPSRIKATPMIFSDISA
jgi:hypothetical protein